jgi:monoamine oxidase
MEAAGRAGRDVPSTEVVDATSRWSPLFAAWSAMMTSVDLDAVSTLDHARYVDTKENWVIPEGFGALIARFGAGLPVTLNAPVTRIDWGGHGVRLETPQGTVQVGAAVLTASTAVLASGRIRFDPALPDWKASAIDAVPLGNANKIAFSVRRDIFGGPEGRFSIFSSTGPDALNFQVRPCGELVVAAFVGGGMADALEKAGAAAAKALALERLTAIFGADFKKEVAGACVTAWRGDPYIGGGYSAAKPGEAHRRADLAIPVSDRLFFAGEAIHMDFYSTAHGAYLSGVAAVEAAARALRAA